jgi:hypothetical protein
MSRTLPSQVEGRARQCKTLQRCGTSGKSFLVRLRGRSSVGWNAALDSYTVRCFCFAAPSNFAFTWATALTIRINSCPIKCSQNGFAPVLATFLLGLIGCPFFRRAFSWALLQLIPASGSFAASVFAVPPLPHWVPSAKAAARFGSRSLRLRVPQENGARKRRKIHVLPVKWNRSGLQFAR